MTKDLTSGNPMQLILGFSIPVFFSYLFQQFYNLADTVIVGQCLGVSALAAVGSTGSVCFLVIGGCMGICSGFAIPVAQTFGAKRFDEMRAFVAGSIRLTALVALVVTTITVVFCKQILSVMKTPADIFDEAYLYLVILLAGIPVSLAYNLLAAVIRSLGDSKTPLLFLVISSILNIGLDLFFILVLGMGVEGAALATVISQGISSAGCFVFVILKFPMLRLSKKDWSANYRNDVRLLSMGLPMGLQYSITAIGSMILQAAVNSLGSLAVASIATAQRIGMFFCCPFDAMGTTMATFGGQNTGARKFDRLNAGIFSCSFLGLVYAVLAFFVMFFFSRHLGLLFVDAGERELLDNVRTFLVINSAFYFPLALVNIVRFMIQGMGFSRLALFAGIFELVGRGVLGLAFVPIFGYPAACFASPVAWVLADCFLIPAYFVCKRKLERSRILLD